ncbi:hypothetical protein Sgly_1549 [Syntrophobotulus glycolicus DSM 8271]|uniref:DUF3793 family protein n=1 Tax=Syntrophobotulus glycolicus (strain DSM 8271 / FlGlyR) TaxID=645991 RepID=F0SXL6_SYNGF|nr:DUF3793 family protein [Syntrophobotulus glycolicus]ADY55849.1 hypothetical protein Sgly_1549 [Syntrophobotulus glycolicus DSM 8271]
MNKAILEQFNQYLNKREDDEYLFMKIAFQAAPTLVNIKPSSLIALSNHSRDILNIWEEQKDRICSRLNVYYFELLKSENHISILFYQRNKIVQTLEKTENKDFLKNMGYCIGNLEDILQRLKKRFQEKFPHEIGIFLGYPLEDVKGFIEYQGTSFLLCGYWKVYHNPEQALKVFRKYDLARMRYLLELMTQ